MDAYGIIVWRQFDWFRLLQAARHYSHLAHSSEPLLNVLVRNIQIIARRQTLTKTAGTGPQSLTVFQEMVKNKWNPERPAGFHEFWIILDHFVACDSFGFVPNSFRFTIFLLSMSPYVSKAERLRKYQQGFQPNLGLWNGLADWPAELVTIHDCWRFHSGDIGLITPEGLAKFELGPHLAAYWSLCSLLFSRKGEDYWSQEESCCNLSQKSVWIFEEVKVPAFCCCSHNFQ